MGVLFSILLLYLPLLVLLFLVCFFHVLVSNFETCGCPFTLGVGSGRNLKAKHPSVSWVVCHLVRLGLGVGFINQVPRWYIWSFVYLVGKKILGTICNSLIHGLSYLLVSCIHLL